MNKNITISLFLIASAIFMFIISFVIICSNSYPHAKNLEQCNQEWKKQMAKNEKVCAVWDGAKCRKGKMQEGSCNSSGNHLDIVFIILGVILLFISGFFFYRSGE